MNTIITVLLYSFALIFLTNGSKKLVDIDKFTQAVGNYYLLPYNLVPIFSKVFITIEFITGAFLLFPPTQTYGTLMALCIMSVITLAISFNLLRGHTDVSCGCGGFETEQGLSWLLVIRNVTLTCVILLTVMKPPTPVSSWIDYTTIVVGTICVFGIYVLYSQLIANHFYYKMLRTT